MFSGSPLPIDTQCPSDSSCRWDLHLQHDNVLVPCLLKAGKIYERCAITGCATNGPCGECKLTIS